MKCTTCNNDIDTNDYCVCRKCHGYACTKCADKQAFVCTCGGDMAYLS